MSENWARYRSLWLGMGGHWITRVSAAESIRLLGEHLGWLEAAGRGSRE